MVAEKISDMIKGPYLYRKEPSALGMRAIYKDGDQTTVCGRSLIFN
jgi:hypothetical protein